MYNWRLVLYHKSAIYSTMFEKYIKQFAKQHQGSSKAASYIALCSADELLTEPGRKALIDNIPNLLLGPCPHYESFYGQLLANYAEFVQKLNATQSAYYYHPGGMLDLAVNAAYNAVELLVNYVKIKKNKTPPNMDIWEYAAFSASLLREVGRVVTEHKIMVYNQTTHHETPWQPWLGNMLAIGNSYHDQPVQHHDYRYRYHITPLLARQLMPKDAFAWLAQTPDILRAWLIILLNDDDSGSGGMSLREIINLAYLKALTQFLAQELAPGLEIDSLLDMADLNIDVDAKTKDPGTAFLVDLVQTINKQPNSINQENSAVHNVEEGVLLVAPTVFEEFADRSKASLDAAKIERAFVDLGITDRQKVEYFDKSNNRVVEGYLVHDAEALILNSSELSSHLKIVVQEYFANENDALRQLVQNARAEARSNENTNAQQQEVHVRPGPKG